MLQHEVARTADCPAGRTRIRRPQHPGSAHRRRRAAAGAAARRFPARPEGAFRAGPRPVSRAPACRRTIPGLFTGLVQAIFTRRRKTLANALLAFRRRPGCPPPRPWHRPPWTAAGGRRPDDCGIGAAGRMRSFRFAVEVSYPNWRSVALVGYVGCVTPNSYVGRVLLDPAGPKDAPYDDHPAPFISGAPSCLIEPRIAAPFVDVAPPGVSSARCRTFHFNECSKSFRSADSVSSA